MTPNGRRVVALSGGIGGAKLALGLSGILPGEDLAIIANPGDDFEHLGLAVSPDTDTLLYTLSGLANPEAGWGRKDESWNFMAALAGLGGETWFNLGDRDLALHVERTRRLGAGESLTRITDDVRRRLAIDARILPASDDPVRTVVETTAGDLAFQHYFVRDKCEPVVTGFRFEGAAGATASPEVLAALADPKLGAVVVCPSNPFISIDPILAVPGLRDAIKSASAPVIAVSPIVGGRAIKGPTAKMMAELGLPTTAAAVARHYGGLLDGFVLDTADASAAAEIDALGLQVLSTNTVMRDLADKRALARAVLDFAGRIAV